MKFKDTYTAEPKDEGGVPQGSCLRPLLYNIYTNYLEKTITDCSLTMYTDDLKLVISDNDISQLRKTWKNTNKLQSNYVR